MLNIILKWYLKVLHLNKSLVLLIFSIELCPAAGVCVRDVSPCQPIVTRHPGTFYKEREGRDFGQDHAIMLITAMGHVVWKEHA